MKHTTKDNGMKTVIGIQDKYIAKVNESAARWSDSRRGGHLRRVKGAAFRAAKDELKALGFTETQAHEMMRQADDVAELQRNAEEE